MKESKVQEELLNTISETISSIDRLRDKAYQQYRSTVRMILQDEITEEKQIERIMDGLLDFCDEQRFLKLYKELCRHIFDRYPQLVGEHISIYRSLFESE